MTGPVRPEALHPGDTSVSHVERAEMQTPRVAPLHPWFLRVAGPPGVVLGVLYAAGIGWPGKG